MKHFTVHSILPIINITNNHQLPIINNRCWTMKMKLKELLS